MRQASSKTSFLISIFKQLFLAASLAALFSVAAGAFPDDTSVSYSEKIYRTPIKENSKLKLNFLFTPLTEKQTSTSFK